MNKSITMEYCKTLIIFILLHFVNWNYGIAQDFYIDSAKIDIIGKPILLNLNNDGYADLLILNKETTEPSFNTKLFLNSEGTFIEKEDFASLSFRGSADFNNDSFEDLLFVEYKNKKHCLISYLNDGNANFTINQKFESNGSTHILNFVDVNGDGFKDIVCKKDQQKFDEVLIYFNNNGVFKKEQKVKVNGQIKEIKSVTNQYNNSNDLIVYHRKLHDQEYISLIRFKNENFAIIDSIALDGNYIRTSLGVLSSKDGRRNHLIFTGLNRGINFMSSSSQLTILSYSLNENRIVQKNRDTLRSVEFDYYHGGASIFSDKNHNYICLNGQLTLNNTLIKDNSKGYDFAKISANFKFSCSERIVEIDDISDIDNIDIGKIIATPQNSFYITDSDTGDIDNDGDIDIVVTKEVFGKCEKKGIYFIINNTPR